MIPIIKNIRVVDEQGNEYGATYPKRAKGLIKNGRARFINDNVICLACPPNKDKNLEDIIMSNDILNQDEFTYDSNSHTNYSWEYALEQIEKIQNDSMYINEAIEAIMNMPVNDSMNGGYGDQAKAEAVGQAVKAREETNQKLIEFYSRMYSDLNPTKSNNPNTKEVMQQMIVEKISNINIGDLDDQSDFIDKLMRFAKEM